MSLETIYYIGQTIAVLAVLASLIFVGIQLKQNAKATMLSVYESAMTGYNEHNRFIANDEKLSSIARRGTQDLSQLDVEERYRFNYVIWHFANHVYKLFRLYERGAYPESEWEGAALEAKQIFSSPGLADFLENNHRYADLKAHLEQYPARDFTKIDGWTPKEDGFEP